TDCACEHDVDAPAHLARLDYPLPVAEVAWAAEAIQARYLVRREHGKCLCAVLFDGRRKRVLYATITRQYRLAPLRRGHCRSPVLRKRPKDAMYFFRVSADSWRARRSQTFSGISRTREIPCLVRMAGSDKASSPSCIDSGTRLDTVNTRCSSRKMALT